MLKPYGPEGGSSKTDFKTVYLIEGNEVERYGVILKIDGTPGQWYLGSLWAGNGRKQKEVPIDGYDWLWTNCQEVYNEVDNLVRRQQGWALK